MNDVYYLLVWYESTTGAGEGQMCEYDSGSWTEDGGSCDLFYRVYGNIAGSGAGGTPDWNEGDADSTIAGLMWWFIYLIVMLGPAWFLGGFLKMGKWGFVIGLAIGAGIGYAFLTGFPLWLLVLVAVGEAGLVYSTVSREA